MDIQRAIAYARKLQEDHPEEAGDLENVVLCLIWIIRYDDPYLGRTTDDDNGVW
jgi:hypothetical protein